MRFTKMRTLDFALKISRLNLNSHIFCVQRKYKENMMKKNFLNLIFVAGLFSIAALLCSCQKKSSLDLLEQIKQRGEITVAMEGVWAPWTYHDESDELVGFDVEVAKAIAQKLGVRAKFAEVEWDGIFAGMDSKRYDIALNGVEITPEREQKYDFSIPYGYIRTALVVRSDNSDIKTFKDLNGKVSTNSLGSTYADLAESFGANVITIDTLEETIQLVEHGRADATLNAEVSFMDYFKEHPNAKVKIVALTEEASQVAIPVRKGKETETLKAAINTAIEELRADGTLSAISQKYFGKDISE